MEGEGRVGVKATWAGKGRAGESASLEGEGGGLEEECRGLKSPESVGVYWGLSSVSDPSRIKY